MKDGKLAMACREEQAVLGHILALSEKTEKIVEMLGDGTCFADESHRTIYEVALTLLKEGKKPDLVTVVKRLAAGGQLSRIGGATYVSDLLEPHPESLADHYCNTILDDHKRRQLIESFERATKHLKAGMGIGDVIEGLGQNVEMLSRTHHTYLVRTTQDIIESAPDIAWCIEDLLPSNGVGILCGDGGLGKTWLAIDLAINVARGTHWMGRLPTARGPVLYIDEEGGDVLIRDRLMKMGIDRQSAPVDLLWLQFSDIQLDSAEGQAALRGLIRRFRLKLVIIDSLSNVHTLDENKASEMKLLARGLVGIARHEECAILLLHHTRKAGQYPGAASQMIRGSTALRGGVDLTLLITKKASQTCMRIERDKSRFVRRGPPIFAALETLKDGSLRIVAKDENETKLDKAKRIILRVLESAQKPLLREDLEKACLDQGVGKRTFAKALKVMVEQGELGETPGDSATAKRLGRRPKAFYLIKEPIRRVDIGPHSPVSERGATKQAPRRMDVGGSDDPRET